MSDIALRYENIGFFFPGTGEYALKDITFSVRKGEMVAILGHSGSGKTTLIKLANLLLSPSTGVIYLGSEDVSKIDTRILRMKMGCVIQQVGLFPHMTVEENISIIPRLNKWPLSRINVEVDKLLDLTRLPVTTEFKKRHPWQLSGGQQQRVGIARALCSDPEILLMDEPFGALDLVTRTQLQEELVEIQRVSGKTILFVTHDLQEAVNLGDRILVLKHGIIQQFDTPKKIIFHPQNNYVEDLCGTKSLSRKLRYFKVADFSECIIRDERLEGLPLDWEDSMDRILDSMLGGKQSIPVVKNKSLWGVFHCDTLELLYGIT
jgi:osmoprotectant transport system ATP-binding protein